MKITVAVLTVIIMLTGCAFGAIEDMLSPPRLTDEQQAIYTALVDSKGSGFKLKYPRTGEYRSAFVVYGENDSAALVFYEISGINIERALLVNFLYKNADGKWESLYEFPIRGIDIESVSFAAFGEDEEENILLSYAVGQNEKRCMIISNIGNKPEIRFEDSYSFMAVDSFFGREYKELLLIKTERSVQTATAAFYTYKGGELFRSAQSELDPGAGEYTEIMQGDIAQGVPVLFINHRKHDSADFGTDMLFYRGDRLVNPIIANSENIERTIRRTGMLTELANPRDIDGDGFVLLPSSAGEFQGYAHLPAQERLRPVVWRALSGNVLVEKYYSYYSERLDFVFLFPQRWIDAVTVAVNFEENTVSFFKATEHIEEAGELILSISVVFENGRFNHYLNQENPDNPLTLTEEEIEFAFRILSEIGAD